MKNRILITLIHGTFAKNNKWTNRNSVFRNRLKQEFGRHNITVEFKVFSWSGKNSHSDRLLEAKNLKEYLSDSNINSVDHYLICHSHAGNIVNYTEKIYSAEEMRINGIVNLATPFLLIAKRNLGKSRLFLTYILASILTFLTFPILSSIEAELQFDFPKLTNFQIIMFTISIFAVFYFFFQKLYTKIVDFQVKNMAQLEFQESQLPNLVIYHKKDEVIKLFKLQKILYSIPFVLWNGINFILFSLFLFILFVLFLGDFEMKESLNVLTDFLNNRDWIIFFIIFWIATSLSLLFILQILMILLPYIIVGHKLGFGKTSLLTNATIKITGMQRNKWHKNCIEITDNFSSFLKHSIYDHPNVPIKIVNWIRDEINSKNIRE